MDEEPQVLKPMCTLGWCRTPSPGMMCTLMYGICILLGQFTARDELWRTVSNQPRPRLSHLARLYTHPLPGHRSKHILFSQECSY